jgi:hypothetical protein
MAARTTAVYKRDHAPARTVKVLTEPKGAKYPAGRMLIASPLAMDAALRTVPAGRVVTMPALRADLARQFGADYTCPITTGIFLRILAEAALEDGRAPAVPVWCVVRADGGCLDRIVGGPASQAARLQDDGVTIVQRRGRWFVADLERVAVILAAGAPPF